MATLSIRKRDGSAKAGAGGQYSSIFIQCQSLIFCAVTFETAAAPMFGVKHERKQPDGSIIAVRLWGDEFHQVIESLDGYTLIRDPRNGFSCYARLSADGDELLSTGIPAGRERPPSGLATRLRVAPDVAERQARLARTRRGADPQVADAASVNGAASTAEGLTEEEIDEMYRPTYTGEIQGLCLLVDFPDHPWTIPAAEIERYCNEIGYGEYGSVRDYFFDVSNGMLTFTQYVTPYYTTIKNKDGYYYPGQPIEVGAREIIQEALEHLESTGFDFDLFDSNDDGLIDAISCYHVGQSLPGIGAHAHTIYTFAADGVYSYKYHITPIWESIGPFLGYFCHETGHMLLDWTDLYDYGLNSNGIGLYGLMANSPYRNPNHPCAYCKYLAGWTNTIPLETPQTGLVVTAGTNTIYKYDHHLNDQEYYLIENRQQTGRDIELPDAGLAIWHIDEAVTTGNNKEHMTPELHYLVTLVQADGNWDLEHDVNVGDSTDLWSAPDYTDCGPDTNPNTSWWDTSPSHLTVTNVSPSDSSMTFDFLPVPPKLVLSTKELNYSILSSDGLPDDSITIANGGLTPLTYTISEDCGWLSVSPDIGDLAGEVDTVDILYDNEVIGSFLYGQYTASITVSSAEAYNSPETVDIVVNVDIKTIAPDFDSDWDVDQEDFGLQQACCSGSGELYEVGCERADLDHDMDVDGDDLAIFRDCTSGANVPADPDCAD